MVHVLVELVEPGGFRRTIAVEDSRETAFDRVNGLVRTDAWHRLYGAPCVGQQVVLTDVGQVGEEVESKEEIIFTLKAIGDETGMGSLYYWVGGQDVLPPGVKELLKL
jgi:hypothetical protein